MDPNLVDSLGRKRSRSGAPGAAAEDGRPGTPGDLPRQEPAMRAAKRRALSLPHASEPEPARDAHAPSGAAPASGPPGAPAPRRAGTQFRPATPSPLSREFGTRVTGLQSMPPTPTSPCAATWSDECAARDAIPAESLRRRLQRHFSPGAHPAEGPSVRSLVRHS